MKTLFRNLLVAVGLLVVFIALWAALPRGGTGTASEATLGLSYSDFKDRAEHGDVATAVFSGYDVRGEVRSNGALEAYRTRIPSFGDPELLPLLERKDVEVTVEAEKETSLGGVIVALLPWVLILGFWWFVMRRSLVGDVPGGTKRFDPFRSGAAARGKAPPPVTFADVAGQQNAKNEVAELVEFLRNPDKYWRMGAEVPHGVLLMGPPGTGKTLLARALAGEAGVPFFHASASEFMEVFVGVGASRVRKLFENAKADAPSIVFIDELDSVGRMRGAGLGAGHDEREQTLNQILAEMDGFEGHEAVVVLAATNRPDVLDPALLRPGRFDRHVELDLPDRPARVDILKVHARRVPLAPDVDLDRIAAGTPGFSGADLKNLVNEAAMSAAREGSPAVSMLHFDAMRDRILLGAPRTLAILPDERHRLAVHESGHAAVAYFLAHADPLQKVTIIPRGRSLGSTLQVPEAERHTLPEPYLRDRLAITMGGRAAERVLLGNLSSGADEDIRMATQLARSMVGRWGMSEEVGPVDVRQSDEHPFLGRDIAQPRQFSEATARAADQAVQRLLVEAERRAAEVLQNRRPRIEALVAVLERKETLDRAEVESCLGPPSAAIVPVTPSAGAGGS